VVLGSTVEQATLSPLHLRAAASLYRGERFILTFRRDTSSAHVVLCSGAKAPDYVKAAYSAHVLLFLADSVKDGLPSDRLGACLPQWMTAGKPKKPNKASRASRQPAGLDSNDMDLLVQCREVVEDTFPLFLERAEGLGWKLDQTMLNPKETRLISMMHDATKPLI